MSDMSPITELIMVPIQKKILSKYKTNNNTFLQIYLILITLSLYFIVYSKFEKSSVLYLISYLFLFNFLQNEKQNHKLQLGNLLFFSFNFVFVLLIMNYKSLKNEISLIVLGLSFLAFCIKNKLKNVNTDSKCINNWCNITNKISKKIYPDNNDNLKKYHIENFWKLFDFSTLSLFIFILISYEKLS